MKMVTREAVVGASRRVTKDQPPPPTIQKDHHTSLQSIKNEAITMLKVVILAMCFEGDITFVISELKAKASLKKFTGF